MKASDVLKEHVKWLSDRCKALKKLLDEEKKDRSFWYDNDISEAVAQARLDECVSIKIATEKYMKKLRHEGS